MMLPKLTSPTRSCGVSSEGFFTPASLTRRPRGVCVICSMAVPKAKHVCRRCDAVSQREAQSLSLNPNPVNSMA